VILAPQPGDLAIVAPSRTTAAVFGWQDRFGGIVLRLRLHWHVRDLVWTLDLADAGALPIVSGLTVVPGVPLVPLADDRLPPGVLFAADREGMGRTPGRRAWAETHGLYYRGALL
jgi:hypothetical protein